MGRGNLKGVVPWAGEDKKGDLPALSRMIDKH
jgi:hypothetical protein